VPRRISAGTALRCACGSRIKSLIFIGRPSERNESIALLSRSVSRRLDRLLWQQDDAAATPAYDVVSRMRASLPSREPLRPHRSVAAAALVAGQLHAVTGPSSCLRRRQTSCYLLTYLLLGIFINRFRSFFHSVDFRIAVSLQVFRRIILTPHRSVYLICCWENHRNGYNYVAKWNSTSYDRSNTFCEQDMAVVQATRPHCPGKAKRVL